MLRATRLVTLKILDSKGKVRKHPKKEALEEFVEGRVHGRGRCKKDAVRSETGGFRWINVLTQDW